MACTSVELSHEAPPLSPEAPPHPSIPLHPCTACGAAMLLMSVTYASNYPIKLRKTYQCFVCKTVEVLVAPRFE